MIGRVSLDFKGCIASLYCKLFSSSHESITLSVLRAHIPRQTDATFLGKIVYSVYRLLPRSSTYDPILPGLSPDLLSRNPASVRGPLCLVQSRPHIGRLRFGLYSVSPTTLCCAPALLRYCGDSCESTGSSAIWRASCKAQSSIPSAVMTACTKTKEHVQEEIKSRCLFTQVCLMPKHFHQQQQSRMNR
jgi:hypothetical protein